VVAYRAATADESPDREVLEHMKQRSDASAGLVLLSALVGSMRLESITDLLREAHRIVRSDGILIIEDRNAGAGDPGTQLSVETVVDLALRAGFIRPELGFPLRPGEEAHRPWLRSRYLLQLRKMAELQELRHHWEILGEEDPFWAVLTEPGKRGGGWQLEEVLAEGESEVAKVLGYLQDLPFTCGRGRALDFGCGVGRLTHALARYYEQVDGVDISEKMLEQARKINQDRANCRFHHVTEPCLPFAEATFDLIYTVLVLQHMSTKVALDYIAELVRVLKPGGAGLFQAPARNLVDRKRTVVTPVACGARLARLEMHAHPRQVVEQAIVAAGGSILAVESDWAAGIGFESFVYIVTR
jgi:SAM-dependent methyltransferase